MYEFLSLNLPPEYNNFSSHVKSIFNCITEPLYDDILLVTDWSHNKIYLVSLVDNDDVRAVDIDTAGNPNAVIYDSINKRVVWGDTKDQQIHSAYMNGSDHKVLVYSGMMPFFSN